MKSLTKVDLSVAQLETAVRAAFGPDVALVQSELFTEGWFNTIYGLELSDGRRLALKLAPKPGVPVLRYEQDLLNTEVAVYTLLQKAELPAPRVHFFDRDGTAVGVPFFVMDRLDFATYAQVKPTLSDADRRQVEFELGKVNARINAIQGREFGPFRHTGFRSSQWSEVITAMFNDVLQDAGEAGTTLPWEPSRMMRAVSRHDGVLNAVTSPRLVHWDLHDANVFVDALAVRGVIDGDRALWGDPLMEVYFSSLFDKTHFLKGYGDAIVKAPGAAARRAVYDVYLGLVMVVECDFRGFDDGHRAWTAQNLTRCLEKLDAL